MQHCAISSKPPLGSLNKVVREMLRVGVYVGNFKFLSELVQPHLVPIT